LKGFPDRWRLHEATPGEMPALIAHVVPPGDGFVGRDQERLDIRLVLDRAATGTGGIVLLAGTPGIGASRLAAEVSGEASRKGWVVLDDLQWADEATVLLLRDLAERLGNSKIVVLGTYWESDLDPERPFTGVVARLLRRRRAQRIALGRLTDAEVEKMLMSLAGGALTAVQVIGIQAATEGNPLFVEHSYLYMAESEGLLGGVRARSQAS